MLLLGLGLVSFVPILAIEATAGLNGTGTLTSNAIILNAIPVNDNGPYVGVITII